MKDFETKIKLIYLPLLKVSFAYIFIYSVLNWAIIIQTGLIFLMDEELSDFALPIVCSFITSFICLRKEMSFFVNKKGRNGAFGLLILTGVSLSFLNVAVQKYLTTATAKLTPLENIAQVDKAKKSKYYTVKNFIVAKNKFGILKNREIIGKHDEKVRMEAYMVAPILLSASDTLETQYKYWIGKAYVRILTNRLEDDVEKELYTEFVDSVSEVFNKTDFNDFEYLKKLGSEGHFNQYQTAVINSGGWD